MRGFPLASHHNATKVGGTLHEIYATKVCRSSDVNFEDIESSKRFPKWVLRGFRVSELSKIKDDALWLISDNGTSSLVIPSKTAMRFGSETVSADDYSKRVLEKGDFIDAIIKKQAGAILNAEAFWVQIRYRDQPTPGMKFHRKDDGLFAMRAKAGEKAERIVASKLMTQSQHTFNSTKTKSPGFFEISYADKKVRKPDLICQSCGLQFEVKKRNRDFNFRVSHSRDRNFSSENNADGWHAFVFPDNTVQFVRNCEIISVIQSGRAIEGSDQYDTWADVNEVKSETPPLCINIMYKIVAPHELWIIRAERLSIGQTRKEIRFDL